MTPPNANTVPTSGAGSKITKVKDTVSTAVEGTITVFGLLASVTEDVPYLNIISGCIQKLIDIRKTMRDNKDRANDLINKAIDISTAVAQGLSRLEKGERTIAGKHLEADLKRYKIILDDTKSILEEWTSGFKYTFKHFWKKDDFPGIADGLDRRLNAFRDAFSIARLTDLASGQAALAANVTALVKSDTRSKLKEWLQSGNSADVVHSDAEAASKRSKDTGSWLLERAEFKQWIYARGSLLWIEGIPGSGKTVLSSTIIRALHARENPTAFYYFDTANPRQRTFPQLLSSLTLQLSAQAPIPDKTLDSLWRSHGDGRTLPSNPDLVAQALLPILKEFSQPVYIVLDALDECDNRTKLLEFVTNLMDAELDLHLLLTSRPEVPRTNAKLADRAIPISLEGCVNEDIKSYVSVELSKMDGDWTEAMKARIKETLFRNSDETFYLVSLQLEELRLWDGSKSSLDRALSNMPTTLSGIFNRILEKIKDPHLLSSVGRIINWLLFARCSVTLDEIIDALALNFGTTPLRFKEDERMFPKAVIEACGGFISVSKDFAGKLSTLKLSHASVKEYFLPSDGTRRHIGDCEISKQAAHHQIASTCVAYLSSLHRPLVNNSDLSKYPLACYCAEYWAFHVTHYNAIGLDQCSPATHQGHTPNTTNHTEDARMLINALLELFGQPDRAPYMTLCRIYDIDHGSSFQPMRTSKSYIPPLYLAVFAGIGQVVEELLAQGADVHAQFGKYANVLQVASRRGYVHIACLLLKWGARVDAVDKSSGTALHLASREGHSMIMCLLLDHKADINMLGGYYGTALQVASYQGHSEIVRLLLDHDANVNVQGGYYGTALQAACASQHREIIRLLLDHGADVNVPGVEYCSTPLQEASSNGDTETICLLLDHKADINTLEGLHGTALQAASYWGHSKIVRLLLDRDANVDVQGGYYGTALQVACAMQHREIIRLLLDRGADVNVLREHGGTVLHVASSQGDTETICLLLDHKADVNMLGGYYGTALQAASSQGHSKIVHLLLDHGADIDMLGGPHGTALQAACYFNKDIETIHLLLDHGADVNVLGGLHGTALQAASYWGHSKIVRLLLDRDANVDVQGGYYGTALQAACAMQHREIIHLLLDRGADVNVPAGKHCGTPLQEASSKGDTETICLLLDHNADINMLGGHYGTALQAASYQGYSEIVHLLLDCDANVNVLGGRYGTALQAASYRGHSKIVRLLLDHGADVNMRGGRFGTALRAACEGSIKNMEIIRFLLDSGAESAEVDALGGRYHAKLQAASYMGGQLGGMNTMPSS